MQFLVLPSESHSVLSLSIGHDACTSSFNTICNSWHSAQSHTGTLLFQQCMMRLRHLFNTTWQSWHSLMSRNKSLLFQQFIIYLHHPSYTTHFYIILLTSHTSTSSFLHHTLLHDPPNITYIYIILHKPHTSTSSSLHYTHTHTHTSLVILLHL